MKRFYISLLTIIFAAIQLIAAPVDPEKALEIANDFWAKNVSLKKNIQSRLVAAEGALKASSRTASSKEQASYYVFTGTDNNGFVIVSGDDRLNPIVGYSTSAVSGEMPPALTAWLGEYSEYVNDVRAGKVVTVQRNARQASAAIEPMLVTAWDQDKPYNNMCPILENGKRGYTGCGNTATAQVMRFHKWPASPIADVEWESNITGETEFCELKSHVYDWDNMLYNYKSEYSEAQGNAVALLMADLGKATQSEYMPGMTGNISPDIAYALVHVFNYSPELFIAERNNYTYEEYIALIRENLSNRQPIVYCGYGQDFNGGHGFVCDGIDENDLLHIDWGWNGLFNGYFDMAIMEPEGNGTGGFSDRYNLSQHAIVNIKPRAEGEVNKGGTPKLDWMTAYDTETEEEVSELRCEFVDGMAEVSTLLSIYNMSHSAAEVSIGIGILDKDGNLARDIEFGEPDIYPRSTTATYEECNTFYVSNVSDREEYLPVGKYVVCVFYMKEDEVVECMRGAFNGLVLEVTENGVTLSSPMPNYELDKFHTVKMPEHSNGEFVFNATFANNSKINRFVVLVPVINRYEDGVKVESRPMTDAAVLSGLLDVNNIIVTFTIPNAFAQSGIYTVSFEYIYREERTDPIDTDKLKSIAGESAPFEVEIIPTDTNGVEQVEDYGAGIDFDWNSNVVSVPEAGVIELFDASGRLLKKVNGNNVSIADLETGIYIVKYNKHVVKVVKR